MYVLGKKKKAVTSETLIFHPFLFVFYHRKKPSHFPIFTHNVVCLFRYSTVNILYSKKQKKLRRKTKKRNRKKQVTTRLIWYPQGKKEGGVLKA